MSSFNYKILNKLKKLSNGGNLPPLLLCVSGGIDSMVMLDTFKKLSNSVEVLVSHINYNVHEFSKKAEELVKNYCENNNIEYQIISVQIENKENFEAHARKIRYNIFNEILVEKNLKFMCTAHHLDDQIETLMMKYSQKAPITSFRGIIEKDKNKWRPFLDIPKSVIIDYASSENISWVEDNTNKNLRYLRNRFRINEIPKIKQENPNLIKELFHLKNKADKLFKQAKSISQELFNTENIIKCQLPEYYEIQLEPLVFLNENIRKIIIQSILNNFEFNLQSMTNLHWTTFWQFLEKSETGKEFKFSENIKALYNRNNVILFDKNKFKIEKQKLTDGLFWYNSKFNIVKDIDSKNSELEYWSVDKFNFKNNIFVRNWKVGDKILDSKSRSQKKISDIFKKNKFSKINKMMHPIVVDNNDTPLWVPNFRHNNCYINNSDEKITIKWQQN